VVYFRGIGENEMTDKTCSWCDEPINEDEEFTELLGEFSHKKYEEKYFEDQEKRVKILKNIDDFGE